MFDSFLPVDATYQTHGGNSVPVLIIRDAFNFQHHLNNCSTFASILILNIKSNFKIKLNIQSIFVVVVAILSKQEEKHNFKLN